MSISYVRPAKAATAAPRSSQSRQELQRWVEQYRRLTRELQAAQVKNKDKMVKEQVDLRGLYNQRASAVALMADAAEKVLEEA